ncbi:Wzz/FepE/Etk N-terminal domain-containing protein [Pseudoalteromonas shioyasakiensis]|uniref:Wzz/FepE/Etk N-terminal domain-containing protein n=1 Tax=Pseudoalteromonas shioyasakiensis TaxID=1190813 RepID=UPI002118BFE2|nr:Wzz/FepE/Etk N-terminal domain-containing protein [Pseudoalteromonas shioyasakiensis]MCQ8879473.1 Wzz/FepE/Etk N-terminal domain-containing protein [Pseudoalteromonas shioyasakiensis]
MTDELKNDDHLFNIDLYDIFKWLWKDKYVITAFTLIFAAVSVIYALSIENKFSSKVTVISNIEDSKSIGGSLGGLGGIASMAGLSLGGSTMSPEVLKEILMSNSFLGNFVVEKNIAPIIMAAQSYDPALEKFHFDEKIYDEKNRIWVRKHTYPQTLEPNTTELAVKVKENLSANYDRKTKLISISYSSYSPYFSKSILTDLVNQFNLYIKNEERTKALKTIEYLKNELGGVGLVEVRVTMQTLLEEQYKKLALAETRDDYAFKVIEEPLVAYKKSEPKRAVICILITFIGLFLSIVVCLTYRILKRS